MRSSFERPQEHHPLTVSVGMRDFTRVIQRMQ